MLDYLTLHVSVFSYFMETIQKDLLPINFVNSNDAVFKSKFGIVKNRTFEFNCGFDKSVLLEDISFLEFICATSRKIKFKFILYSFISGLFFFYYDLLFFSTLSFLLVFYLSFFYQKKIYFIQVIYKVPSRDIIKIDKHSVVEAKSFVVKLNNYLIRNCNHL